MQGVAALTGSKRCSRCWKASRRMIPTSSRPSLRSARRILNKSKKLTRQIFKSHEEKLGSIASQIRTALQYAKEQKGHDRLLCSRSVAIPLAMKFSVKQRISFFLRMFALSSRIIRSSWKQPRRHAVLAGCYSYTKSEFRALADVDLGMRKDSLIVGYDGTGLSRFNPRELQYIDQLIAYANKLDKNP